MTKLGRLLSAVYVILGVYFLNRAFNFISLPTEVTFIDKSIFALSGILLILGAYFFSKYNKLA